MSQVGRLLSLIICVAAIIASFAIASTSTVAQGPPETPQPVLPLYTAGSPPQNLGIWVGILWYGVPNADEYEVRWTRDGEEGRAVVPQEDREEAQQNYLEYWLFDPESGIYDFTVRARNALGDSEWANTIRYRVRETPEPPQVVVDGADLVISWHQRGGATSFDLCVMREYGGCHEPNSFFYLFHVAETSLRVPDLRPGEYQVMLREAGGWLSDWSPWTFIVVPDRGQTVADPADKMHRVDIWRPEVISQERLASSQNLRVRLNGSRLNFEWDPPHGADGYYLAQKRPEAGWWRTRTPRKTLQGLPAGTHYFRVLAYDRISNYSSQWVGQWSDELAVVVPEMHSRGLAASAVETEPSRDGRPYWLATAEWRGLPGAERYQVQWRELRPRSTATKPVILATPTQQGEQSTFTAQLRTRHPATLQISLRAQVNGAWTTWTEWLNLNAELRKSAGERPAE